MPALVSVVSRWVCDLWCLWLFMVVFGLLGFEWFAADLSRLRALVVLGWVVVTW